MLPAHFIPAGRPLIWAHRGASAEAPENTLAAFSLALAQGADGIELDVQRCASGEVVVIHDDSLARTTGHEALVTATPWSVMRMLDAGSWKGDRWRGERIPLLPEVLEAFSRLVNVELKCDRADDGGLTAETIDVIRRARAEDRVLLSSFNPLCLLRARALAPKVARAWLFEKPNVWAPMLGVRALHPHAPLATPARLKRWRLYGYSVACWTVDDPDVASRLWESGVSGIITNRPDVMRAKFG